jgi:uncharacterized protein YjbI with pentapeptide repeats
LGRRGVRDILKARGKGQAVRLETINSENVADVEWDEGYFKLCAFENFSVDGEVVSSDFVRCSFTSIDWYWGLFPGSNFIGCQFTDCSFAGTGFPDTRFVDCKLVNCRFIQDNLGGECGLAETIMYGCSFENCLGPDFRLNSAVSD